MKPPRTLFGLAVWPVLMSPLLLLLPTVETRGQGTPPTAADLQAEADIKTCKDQLARIFEALQQYRAQNGRMPNWFRDLHPELISDSKTFICPVVQRYDDLRSWRSGINGEVFDDPFLPTSYSYEFCAKELRLAPGVHTTYQEYKKRQMRLAGDRVPVVRCFAHSNVLNLSIGGQVYPSRRYWEDELSQVSHHELEPAALFQDLLNTFVDTPRSFPARSASAGPELVDLSQHYNFRLDETWLPKGPERGDFANLPQGIAKFEGLAFDIRGRVQLRGSKLSIPFPPEVKGIKVNRACRRLHFLIGTVDRAPNGTEIGSFEIHFADGQSARIGIHYGTHLEHWRLDPKKPQRSDLQPVWIGATGSSSTQTNWVRLYHLAGENPRPEASIATLDFLSAHTESAPFLMAITLE